MYFGWCCLLETLSGVWCRRLYDCLGSLLDEKGANFSDIRRVLEGGMKTGAVSLMKDVSGIVVGLYRLQRIFG